MRYWKSLAAIFAISVPVPATARDLPPQSLVCKNKYALVTEMKLREEDKTRVDGVERKLTRDCGVTRLLLRVERKNCDGAVCEVTITERSGTQYTAFTLRKYQP